MLTQMLCQSSIDSFFYRQLSNLFRCSSIVSEQQPSLGPFIRTLIFGHPIVSWNNSLEFDQTKVPRYTITLLSLEQ